MTTLFFFNVHESVAVDFPHLNCYVSPQTHHRLASHCNHVDAHLTATLTKPTSEIR